MDHPEGAGPQRADRVDFVRRLRLEFRGAQISSDGDLLLMHEMDNALGLSYLASAALCDNRQGKNTIHWLDGLFRQSVFGRLAGYEDVNDADRLALDLVMRQVSAAELPTRKQLRLPKWGSSRQRHLPCIDIWTHRWSCVQL